MKNFRTFSLRAIGMLSPFKRHFVVILGLLAVSEICGLTVPYVMGMVVNGLQAHDPISNVILVAFAFIGVAMISQLVDWLRARYQVRHIDMSVIPYLIDKTNEKLLSLSIGQHRSQNSGLTLSVVNQGRAAVWQLVQLALFALLPLGVRMTITVLALLWFNWLTGSFVLVMLVGYISFVLFISRRFQKKIKVLKDMGHRFFKSNNEIMRNLSLVKIQGQERRVRAEDSARFATHTKEGVSVWSRYLTFAIGRNAIADIVKFGSLLIGVYLVYSQGLQFGDFLILMFWTGQATADLGYLNHYQRQWLDNAALAEKYFAIHDVKPAVIMVPNPVRPAKYEGRIEFRDVGFTYRKVKYAKTDEDEDRSVEDERADDVLALEKLNFTIEAGSRVAFVGRSGAGKSTVMNLIVRGWNPDSGRILIDNEDLRLLDLEHFLQSVGFVEQHVDLFDDTLRYNLLFGLNGRAAHVTNDQLEEIARVSRIDQFRHRLTKGWDTRIGENGIELSGGERQRVGIARALIKDPSILILDEATSNLDAENEKPIKEAICNASSGRTTLIIAHRLSTVRDVDKIFVMDKGRIVTEGQHKELCETSSIYRSLVENQLFAL